jgi:hypothetical protein
VVQLYTTAQSAGSRLRGIFLALFAKFAILASLRRFALSSTLALSRGDATAILGSCVTFFTLASRSTISGADGSRFHDLAVHASVLETARASAVLKLLIRLAHWVGRLALVLRNTFARAVSRISTRTLTALSAISGAHWSRRL